MPPSPAQPIDALLAAALLLSPSSFAFDAPLSDHASAKPISSAKRRDEKTAEFLDKYRRHSSRPRSRSMISTVEFFTPYAEAVELSRQRSFGYSAQDAAQDYRKKWRPHPCHHHHRIYEHLR